MPTLYDLLLPGPSLEELSMAYIGFTTKWANDAGGGMYEGSFAVELPVLLQHMAEMVKNEFLTIYAYMAYSKAVRGTERGALADLFEEHAADEQEHADWLMERMAAMGGPMTLGDIPGPQAYTDPADIVQDLLRIETRGMALWSTLHQMVGCDPMKVRVEEYMAQEQHHADELRVLLPPPAVSMPSAAVLRPAAPPAGMAEEGVEEAPPKMAVYRMPSAGVLRGKMASDKANNAKGVERASVNAAARGEMHRRTRGEQYGTILGKVLGGTAALAGASKAKGADTARILAVGLGQHVGGHVGKTLGREIDAARTKKANEELVADPNMLAPEAIAVAQQESAAIKAELEAQSEYNRQRAEAAEQQAQQLQEQVASASQQAEQLQQQLQSTNGQLQAAQQAAMSANQSATAAMTQAVNSGQEALNSRQVTMEASMALNNFKQQLRELADAPAIPPDQPNQAPPDQAAPPPAPPAPEAEQGQPPPKTASKLLRRIRRTK